MKYLAWDTSSKAAALVAFEAEPFRILAEMTLNVDATHSENLLWAIHQVLEAARWKLTDLSGFGVGLGPGSFTGLRIGITTARTLADTLKKSLIPVSSLAALLRPAVLAYSGRNSQVYVIAATDACKGELFSLWGSANELLKSKAKEQVSLPQVLIEEIQAQLSAEPRSEWLVLGEGRSRYLETWAQLPKEREIKNEDLFSPFVQARFLAQEVKEGLQAGLQAEPLRVLPLYLRSSDAERRAAQKV